MFDIGWSEILVIAIVAIIVVGPKELPAMLRTFGRTLGTLRRTANDFKRQFDEALREAERDAGLDETRKSLQSISRVNPMADLKKDIGAGSKPSEAPGRSAVEPRPAEPVAPSKAAHSGTDTA